MRAVYTVVGMPDCAAVFRLAKPCSKSVPIILSMFMKSDMAFIMKLRFPSMIQLIRVSPLGGDKLESLPR